MGARLPELDMEQFSRRLAACGQDSLDRDTVHRLHAHYLELRRWNARLSLVGPGTAEQAVERHYAESLAGSGLLESADRCLVDLGSGAGFPGLVLAASNPDLSVWLVEANQRKWAFLRSAVAAAGLSARCLDARVGAALSPGFPDRIDVITIRALKLDREVWHQLARRLSDRGRILCWGGPEAPAELAGWTLGRRHRLSGERRFILELFPRRGGETS